jgi:energy-converting hydrogenase Eha subunit A
MENHLIIVFLYIIGLGFLAGLLGCILNAFVKSIFK